MCGPLFYLHACAHGKPKELMGTVGISAVNSSLKPVYQGEAVFPILTNVSGYRMGTMGTDERCSQYQALLFPS